VGCWRTGSTGSPPRTAGRPWRRKWSGPATGVCQAEGMCRNITTLRGLEPPASSEEVTAAARQYVRKVSGVQQPSVRTAEAVQEGGRPDRCCHLRLAGCPAATPATAAHPAPTPTLAAVRRGRTARRVCADTCPPVRDGLSATNRVGRRGGPARRGHDRLSTVGGRGSRGSGLSSGRRGRGRGSAGECPRGRQPLTDPGRVGCRHGRALLRPLPRTCGSPGHARPSGPENWPRDHLEHGPLTGVSAGLRWPACARWGP